MTQKEASFCFYGSAALDEDKPYLDRKTFYFILRSILLFVIAFSLLKNGFLSQILQANVCPCDAASSREKPAVPLVLCCSLLMRKCCPVLVSSAAARLAVASKFTPAKSQFLFFFNAVTSRKCFRLDLYLNIWYLGQINYQHEGDSLWRLFTYCGSGFKRG